MPISLASTSASSMHGAMVPIASQAVTGSSPSSIQFNNIPQTYQDLMLVGYTRTTSTGTTIPISAYFNAYSATGWSGTYLQGNGSSAISSRSLQSTPTYGVNFYGAAASATSGIFTSYTMHILNYASTSTFKTVLLRAATDLNGSGTVDLTANLWSNTAGVSMIATYFGAGFAVGSIITLYGIRTVGQ